LAQVQDDITVLNVVNEAMAGAARVHIAEKAQDPRRLSDALACPREAAEPLSVEIHK
jgi:hypothetical protein